MYKVLIIDDEKKIQVVLKGIIETFIENVEVVSMAKNVADGVEQILLYKPDIVVLDIEMPDGTGFDLLQQLPGIDFSLIFCTAFNEYAIKAFKYNAIDYILKPFDPEDVITAITKAKENRIIKEQSKQVDKLLSFMHDNKKKNDKIVLKTATDIYVVQINNIYNCQSDGGYTIFMFNDDRKILISTNLKSYEDILYEHGFIKTHKSHLVNTNHIDRVRKKDGGFIVLNNGREIPISSRKRDAIFDAISQT